MALSDRDQRTRRCNLEGRFWQNERLPKLSVLGFTQNRAGQLPGNALDTNGRTLPPDTNAPFGLAQGEEFTTPIEDPNDYPALKARIEKKLPTSNVTAMDGGIVKGRGAIQSTGVLSEIP